MANLDIAIRDRASNSSTLSKKFFKDTTPPSLRILVDGIEVTGDEFYVKEGSIITIEARDEQSGVALIAYRIDSGNWVETRFNGDRIARVEIRVDG
ncbi:MAG: hypothetical protein QXO37_09460 [Candidatus Nitrosocaldaceae archaeon]